MHDHVCGEGALPSTCSGSRRGMLWAKGYTRCSINSWKEWLITTLWLMALIGLLHLCGLSLIVVLWSIALALMIWSSDIFMHVSCILAVWMMRGSMVKPVLCYNGLVLGPLLLDVCPPGSSTGSCFCAPASTLGSAYLATCTLAGRCFVANSFGGGSSGCGNAFSSYSSIAFTGCCRAQGGSFVTMTTDHALYPSYPQQSNCRYYV